MPLRDVRELAHEVADFAGVARSDHGLDTHGDMAAARGIGLRAHGDHPLDELAEVLDAGFPVKDGGHEFARQLAGLAGD